MVVVGYVIEHYDKECTKAMYIIKMKDQFSAEPHGEDGSEWEGASKIFEELTNPVRHE